MSIFGQTSMGSPIQRHQISVANDVQWVEGTLETLGDPHNYINQEDQSVFAISDAHVAPWSFTGLPDSRPPKVIAVKDNVQMLIFQEETSQETFREAIHTETLIFNLPLAVIRGNVPFLSEAKLHNFLDFWKGRFLPVTDARIHYLAGSAVATPAQADLLYINRTLIQSYLQA